MEFLMQNLLPFFLVLLLTVAAQTAIADPVSFNDLLVSTRINAVPQIREYTPSGALVQTFSVPKNPGANDFRGIAMDALGRFKPTMAPSLPY